MKIRLNIGDLHAALNTVSVVKPSNNKNENAYMFSIHEGRCYIHSQDSQHYVRAEVAHSSLEDSDSFVYPVDRTESFRYLDGWIDLESGQDGNRFFVKYKTEGGASADRSTYDPKLFNSQEKALGESGEEYLFPTILLREGIAVTSECLATEPDNNRPFQTLQLFDASQTEWAKGDGTLYAGDGQRSCYFYSAALKGKGLSIHAQHIPLISAFLAKCHSMVKVRIGEMLTFVIDQIPGPNGPTDGAVFGWVHHTNKYQKYSYYPTSLDKFILLTPRDLILKSLRQIKSELKDVKQDKIRMMYSDSSLRFLGSLGSDNVSTVPVGVRSLDLEDGTKSGSEFAANVNVNSLIGLFESARSHEVELRIHPMKSDGGGKEKALFRTVESFWLSASGKVLVSPSDSKEDSYECRVTQFTPSLVD